MPYQGRFVGIFLPQFYLKTVGDGEAIRRRLDDEPEFKKKVRDACA